MINQVHNEDCILTLARMESGSVDLMLTDPPYNTTACDWDVQIDFAALWTEWLRVMKPNGTFIFTASQPFTSALVMSNIKLFRHQWQWIKNKPTGAFGAKYMPMKANEDILVFGRNAGTYNPIMVKRTQKEFNDCFRQNDSMSWGSNITNTKNNIITRKPKEEQWYKYPSNILYFDKDDSRDGTKHPTQKPLDLFRYLIKTYSNENDLVFDGYMGSGTTAIACIKEKRNYIGSELDKTYYDLLTKRINFELQQSTLF